MRWGGRPQTARPNHCAVRPRSQSCLPEPARYVTGTGRVPEKTRRLQRRDKAILAPAATTYTCCAAKDPTGLEHPGKLEHRRSGVRQAMQPVESQRQVKGVVRERQTRDIGLGELHQVGHAEPSGPTACPSQHVRGNVSGHITAILPGAQSAKGEPSAAWDVQHIGARGSCTDTPNLGEQVAQRQPPQRFCAHRSDAIVHCGGVIQRRREPSGTPVVGYLPHPPTLTAAGYHARMARRVQMTVDLVPVHLGKTDTVAAPAFAHRGPGERNG